MKNAIKVSIGIANEGGMGFYLGILEDISGSKRKIFAFLKEKLQNWLNGWTWKWLSRRGKYILIKFTLLALRTYVMSTLLFPVETCENLTSVITQFWWSSNPPKEAFTRQTGRNCANLGSMSSILLCYGNNFGD